jgi:lipopolysaccharide transport system ATP-binding protein
MSDIAIRVKNLSKQYTIATVRHRHDSLRDQIMDGLKSVLRRNGQPESRTETIWALKDVSFEVNRGEVVGIIGRNGAGKSTLLKILSRITEPTFGLAEMYGRIGSLLEVGTGFDRELTGRENIYLNGAILGMKKGEIDRKFDEIVAFAEVEKFIDTPVKRYSSGMYVRLAFAVAAHLEPEILIVDEVLAVGDAAFQQKCLGKMQDVALGGRTVLFVSHNMTAMEYLCQKGIVLQDGKVAFSGSSKEAIDCYLYSSSVGRRLSNAHIVDLSNAARRPPTARPLLKRLELFTDGSTPLNGYLKMGASLKASICFRLEAPASHFDVGLGFDNLFGQRIATAHSQFQPGLTREKRIGNQTFSCEIPSLPLVPGEYKIKVSLDIGDSQVDCVEDAARIKIIESNYYGTGKVPWNGVIVFTQYWYLQE